MHKSVVVSAESSQKYFWNNTDYVDVFRRKQKNSKSEVDMQNPVSRLVFNDDLDSVFPLLVIISC